MDPLSAIANLRAAAAELVESSDKGARRTGERLRYYLENAASGAVLETSLGLMPGEPWWQIEAREKRDKALCELARGWPDKKIAGQAYEIERAAQRYAASAWRFDRAQGDMPESYVGTAKQWLWEAFRSGADMPLKKRQLQTILSQNSYIR